jgi:hypothetical protein
MATSFRLPISIDDGAFSFSHDAVVPPPSLRIYWLANSAKYLEMKGERERLI